MANIFYEGKSQLPIILSHIFGQCKNDNAAQYIKDFHATMWYSYKAKLELQTSRITLVSSQTLDSLQQDINKRNLEILELDDKLRAIHQISSQITKEKV